MESELNVKSVKRQRVPQFSSPNEKKISYGNPDCVHTLYCNYRIIASRTVSRLEVTTVAFVLNRYKTVSKLKNRSKSDISQRCSGGNNLSLIGLSLYVIFWG